MQLSPALLFFLVWAIPLLSPYLVQAAVIQEISPATKWLVVGSGLLFFLMQWAARATVGKPSPDLAATVRTRIDPHRLERKTWMLFKLWLAVYAVNIVFSGGLPLFWVLTGDPRTYADFGLPSLGGLGNILRAFVLAACYLLCFVVPTRRRTLFMRIGAFLLFSAFVLETGRGAGVVLLLHPLAYFFLTRKVRASTVVWLVAAGLLLAAFLGFLQSFRYGAELSYLSDFAESAGIEGTNPFLLTIAPTLLYIAVPIVNTDLNVVLSPLLQFQPYYSMQGLVPTVLRDSLFAAQDYGELVNEANNASSFFIPFVRDFGSVGAFLAVALLHAIVVIVYAKARRGNLFCFLLWPALFMSVALSFFSLFYTALVVVLYPVVAAYFARAIRVRRA